MPDFSTFRNRLAGRQSSSLPQSGMLIGQWVVEGDSHDVFLNTVPAEAWAFLVPEPSGRWQVLTGEGQRQGGIVARAHLPEELEAKSVRAIGERLEELMRGESSWLEWSDVIPLVPEIPEMLSLKPLELLVRDHFGHIEAVCRKPRAHLHVEIECVPVTQSRRTPPEATSYLAAHTEDWGQRLLSGIRPKRVLAEVPQDLLDIYENRVVARLLDNLRNHLNNRICELRKLENVFKEKNFSASISGTHQRKRRMSELWGNAIDSSEGSRKAKTILDELERLKYKVMGLLDSALYTAIPRRTHVPITLNSTNILTNDQHYRRVAELWREWAKTGASQTLNPSELHDYAQRLCRGLDSFSMLLTVRALGILGYAPPDGELDKPIRRGSSLVLQRHGMAVDLRWDDDGTIHLLYGARELTIVALANDLRAGADELVQESLNQIRQGASERLSSDLLILYLASEDERLSTNQNLLASLHTVGNDPRTDLFKGSGCLPVSPWKLGSTERVARALRWFLSDARFSGYPPRIPVPPDTISLIDADQHRRGLATRDGGNTLEIHTPPLENEWKRLNLESIVQEAKTRLSEAGSKHKKFYGELRGATHQKNKTSELKRKKTDARQELQKYEQIVNAAQTLAKGLDDARGVLGALLDCPTCGTKANPTHSFERRDRDCFRCECIDCGSYWEVRLCRKGHRYAAMLPSKDFIDIANLQPGWEDQIYGCDILAIPARKPNGQWGFVCPDCGQIS
ncbi:MAG: DUF2357 domain-containing protein [Planctomycetota bacterium]